MEEIWKFYKEVTSTKYGHRVYEVSNFGRVKINGVIAKPIIHRGYYSVASFGVHRAVAELFIPNPENKREVDHIDNNKLNNRADNLRWVTHKENMNNPLTIQRNKKTHPKGWIRHNNDTPWNKGMKGKYVWVNNGKVMTTIPIGQAEDLIQQGWQYGMIKKK